MINNNNNQEYYLTDIVKLLKDGFEVGYLKVDYNEVQGLIINKIWQELINIIKYLADKYMSQV